VICDQRTAITPANLSDHCSLIADDWFGALAIRAIKSDERLVPVSSRASPRFHIRPIDVVVFHGSSGRTGFEAGFPLRCLQRLSIPHIATLHRRWRDDRSTRDAFTPVLSY
jgi:hypothetical protein